MSCHRRLVTIIVLVLCGAVGLAGVVMLIISGVENSRGKSAHSRSETDGAINHE